MKRFDAIIIGAGQAGPSAGRPSDRAGKTVAFVERKLFGGTCVNTGCMPTKTLVASAYAAHMARRAADFGVVLRGAVAIDMPEVKARADAVSGNARAGVERSAAIAWPAAPSSRALRASNHRRAFASATRR